MPPAEPSVHEKTSSFTSVSFKVTTLRICVSYRALCVTCKQPFRSSKRLSLLITPSLYCCKWKGRPSFLLTWQSAVSKQTVLSVMSKSSGNHRSSETWRCRSYFASSKFNFIPIYYYQGLPYCPWYWMHWVNAPLRQIMIPVCNCCHVVLMLLQDEKWRSWLPRSYDWVNSVNIPQSRWQRECKCHAALIESNFHIPLNRIIHMSDRLLQSDPQRNELLSLRKHSYLALCSSWQVNFTVNFPFFFNLFLRYSSSVSF